MSVLSHKSLDFWVLGMLKGQVSRIFLEEKLTDFFTTLDFLYKVKGADCIDFIIKSQVRCCACKCSVGNLDFE
jgi:hypothetical protein